MSDEIERVAKLMHDLAYDSDTTQKSFWEWRSPGIKGRWLKKAETVIDAMQPEWQDISAAPKDGTEIITVVSGFRSTLGWFDGENWTNHDNELNINDAPPEIVEVWGEEYGYSPTHWMPLPQPPKEQTK